MPPDGFELTDEEQELLNQIAPETTLDQLGGGRGLDTSAADDLDDDEIFSSGEGDQNQNDDDELERKGYVKRTDFDRISGELEGLRKIVGARDPATQPIPQPQPQYVAPQPQPPAQLTKEQRDELQAKFFEDPIGFSNMIAQNAVESYKKTNESQFLETQTSIARSEAQRIREEVARDFPQYKAALPAMDKLMQDTPPETMAALVKSGKLREVYMDNFKAKAFDVAHKVTTAAVTRRRTADTQRDSAPQLGGRGVGSVTAIDRVRSGSKEIRMSELNEVDREAAIQWKKMGWSNADIFRELQKSS